MKARIIYAIPCVNKVTDVESGLTSLINILETGTVPNVPSVLPPLNFSGLVVFEDPIKDEQGNISFGIQAWLTKPNGKRVKLFEELEVVVPEVKIKVNTVIEHIPVEEIGTHYLHLTIITGDGKKKKSNSAKYPLDVILPHPPNDTNK